MTSPAPVTSGSPDAGTWRAPGRVRAGAGDAGVGPRIRPGCLAAS